MGDDSPTATPFPGGESDVTHAARIARLVAGCLMALALVSVWASSASAQESGSITITTYACEGDDCSAPAAGVSFNASVLKLDYSVDGVTDGNGVVTLPLPAENSIGSEVFVTTVPAVNVPAGGDIPFAFDCTKNGGEPVESRYAQIQTDPGGDVYQAAISATDGDVISCNWYLFGAASGEETPPVSELPNTGSGAITPALPLGFTAAFLILVGAATALYAVSRLVRR
jgi:hypothetical protein